MALRREITARIIDLLKKSPQGLSITEIVRDSSINRNTAGRYLDNLLISGQVEMRHFGMAKIYSLSQRLPVSSVLSISSEFVMQLDSSFRVVFLNQPFVELLGTTEKEVLGKNIDFSPLCLYFDETFPLVRSWIQDGIAGTEHRQDLELPSKGRVFFCRIAPTVFNNGQKGVSILFEDITRRRQNEIRIRESESRLRSIIRVAPIGIGIVVDRTFLEVNDQFCRITGYEAGELVGYSARMLYPSDEEFLRIGDDYIGQIRRSGTASLETRWKRKDGVLIDILLNATPLNPADLKAGITFTALDITQRKQAENALRESGERLQLALSGSETGMWELEIPTVSGTIDDRAAGILGYRKADIGFRKFDWDALSHPDDVPLIQKRLTDCLEGTVAIFESEHRMKHASGEWIWVSGRGKITHRLPDGSPLRIVGTIQDITARKEAENALRESEEKFRALFNNAEDMIMLHELNADGSHRNYTEVNDMACRKLGYTRQELLRMVPRDLVAEDFLHFVSEDARRKLHDGGYVTFEAALLTKDRRRLPVEINAHLFEFRGKPVILAIIRDITERKQTEDQLRLMKISIDNAYDEVFWMDMEANFLYVNDAACRVTGYSPEELYAMKVYTLDPDFTPSRWEESIANLRKYKRLFFQTRHRRKDGVIIDVEIGSVYVTRGEQEYSFCFVRDITRRKRIEAALRESEGRYRSLAEVSQDMIYVIDRDDRVTYVNQQAADFLGKTPAEIIGSARSGQFPPDISGRQYQALRHIFDTGQPLRSEGPMTVGGATRWFDHALVPIPGEDGEVASVLGVSRDITKRIEAEEAQRRNREASQFIAEHSVDIINRQTPDCICTYTSPSITTLLGYTPEEVLGKPVLALVHPDDLPAVQKDLARILASDQDTVTSTFRFRHRDGRYLWFESTTRIVRDEAGHVKEFLSISRDITRRTAGKGKTG